MAFPTDFDAAYEAIYEALTTETGRTRALSAEHLFKRIAAQRGSEDIEAYVLRSKRTVLVVLRDLVVRAGAEVSPSNRHAYDGFVEIQRYYRSGNDLFAAEMERARKEAATDVHLVRKALCFPGVLDTNAASEPTGIDGGALTARGHRSRGPEHLTGKGYLAWTDLYPITITLE